MKYKTLFCYITIVCFFSCTPEPINIPNDQRFGSLPEQALDPIDNASTPEKIALGKLLFWDPILSGNKDVACATCHHPENDYAEQLDLSIGVGGQGLSQNRKNGLLIKRNAMTVINTAYNGIDSEKQYDPTKAEMFWDNRAQSLEEQALAPILSADEMRGDAFEETVALDSIVARLKNIDEYRSLFQTIFNEDITEENIAKAIAAFERSLTANNSRFDQYARGDDQAMTATEIRGMLAFSEAGCDNCHNGPMFSDFQLHVIGVPENERLDFADDGAGGHQFRTGPLRNLPNTGPYMHNGRFKTLEDVLDFYEDLSMNDADNLSVPESQLDPKVDELNLGDDQIDAIIAFIKTLNDNSFDKVVPISVPSGLNPGGNID